MMLILAAALVTVAPAVPAPAPTPASSDQAPVALKPTSIKPSTDMRRVCVVETLTGSRIPYKICKTRAEWVAQGVDPLATR